MSVADNLATSNLVERYDLAAKSWEAVAPMGTARFAPAAAVLEDKLYAVGGYNDDESILSSVERYDPALDAWEAVAPMGEERDGLAVTASCGSCSERLRASLRHKSTRPLLCFPRVLRQLSVYHGRRS